MSVLMLEHEYHEALNKIEELMCALDVETDDDVIVALHDELTFWVDMVMDYERIKFPWRDEDPEFS